DTGIGITQAEAVRAQLQPHIQQASPGSIEAIGIAGIDRSIVPSAPSGFVDVSNVLVITVAERSGKAKLIGIVLFVQFKKTSYRKLIVLGGCCRVLIYSKIIIGKALALLGNPFHILVEVQPADRKQILGKIPAAVVKTEVIVLSTFVAQEVFSRRLVVVRYTCGKAHEVFV